MESPEFPNSIRKTSLVNSLLAASISIIANISVIVFIFVQRKSKYQGHDYIYTILYNAAVNIAYSINLVLAAPMIHVHTNELVFVNDGILQNDVLGRISLCIFAFFVIYTMTFSSAQFIIKYFLICKFHNENSSNKIYVIHILALLLAFAWSCLIASSLWTGIHREIKDGLDDELAGKLALNSLIRENAPLIVALVFLFIMVFGSFLIMIVCSRRIACTMEKYGSNRTKNLQIRMYRVLLAEATVPILLIDLPLTISCILPLVGLHIDVVLHLLSLLYAWYPALGPLLVLWNLKMRSLKTKKFLKKRRDLAAKVF